MNKTLEEYIVTYGEALIAQWIRTGETAYLKRKAKSREPSTRSVNAALNRMTADDLKSLIIKAKV